MRKQLLAGIISALLIFCVGYVESAFALNPNLRQVVLAPSLEQQVKAILKKSGGSLYLPSPSTCFTDSAGTTPCAVDDPVGYLKDLIGTNNATQATAGFKPILRGKVKNWLVNTATLSTQSVAVATSGVTWTLSFAGTGTVNLLGGYAGSLVGTGASNRVSLTFTTTVATNVTYLVSGSVTEAQVELGSIANAYVASGATPKSSSYGPYWLDFDGVDDRLQLSSVPFQMNDDHFVSAVATNISKTSVRRIFSIASTSSISPRIAELSIQASGAVQASWMDDSFTASTLQDTVDFTGVPVCSTAVKQANNKRLRRNGQQIGGVNNTVLGTTTPTNAGIGALMILSPNTFLRGGIHGLSFGKTTISDAGLRKIEKYLAKKAEISL
jgi:hypothetical protein